MLYLAIGLIVLAIILFVADYMMYKHSVTDAKNQVDCEKENSGKKEGDHCNVWTGTDCDKTGIIKDGGCLRKGRILPLILLILSGLSLVGGIILLFLKKKLETKLVIAIIAIILVILAIVLLMIKRSKPDNDDIKMKEGWWHGPRWWGWGHPGWRRWWW